MTKKILNENLLMSFYNFVFWLICTISILKNQ